MDEIDFLTVSNPAPSPITEEELATFLAVGKTWQVEEAEYEKEAERAYQLTEMAILDRQRGEIHQREAERDAREAERDQREADRDKREKERDASPDDFHDGWMKRTERARERKTREALRDTRKVERDKREEERKRCKMLADARRQAEMDRRETERDKREAERDRLAREVDQKAYKANRENRVTLLQAVRTQRASFDDRGENDDVFPDAYIKYLSGLTGASSLSDDGKIIEKARELYTKHEPERYRLNKWRNGTFYAGWETFIGQEKLDEYIFNNWIKEKQSNSVIFNEYINMAKKENALESQEKLEKKQLEQEHLEKEQLGQQKEQDYEDLFVEVEKKQLEQEHLEKELGKQKEQDYEDLFVEVEEYDLSKIQDIFGEKFMEVSSIERRSPQGTYKIVKSILDEIKKVFVKEYIAYVDYTYSKFILGQANAYVTTLNYLNLVTNKGHIYSVEFKVRFGSGAYTVPNEIWLQGINPEEQKYYGYEVTIKLVKYKELINPTKKNWDMVKTYTKTHNGIEERYKIERLGSLLRGEKFQMENGILTILSQFEK
jgi:hypothetical protein